MQPINNIPPSSQHNKTWSNQHRHKKHTHTHANIKKLNKYKKTKKRESKLQRARKYEQYLQRIEKLKYEIPSQRETLKKENKKNI